ncbi:MAG TPA: MFS transporter [Gaiellaceae bacterium]|jgi:MFS family permease
MSRFLRRVLGGGIDRELVPLIAVSVPSTLGFGAFWVFVGVWAVRGLGIRPSTLGAVLLLEATVAAGAGYLGGHLSDLVGRRPVLVWSWTLEAAILATLALVDPAPAVGLALLVAAGVASGPGLAASGALVADLVPPERRESAYASMRVVYNVAMVCGPPLAGLVIAAGGWTGFLLFDALLGGLAAAGAALLLPAGLRGDRERAPVTAALRDRPYLLFLASSVLAWIVYVGYESALPIAATTEYRVSPRTWGLLLALNPLLVALLQLRLTRAVARASASAKLAVAIPVMGLSFLALEVDTGLGTIAAVIVVFVLGEMLWAPTATAAAASMAPAHLRGAYMGAFGGTTSAGFAIGPFVGLQLLGGAGPRAMWTFFAAVSLAAAAGSAAAVRPRGNARARSRRSTRRGRAARRTRAA